MNEVTSAYIHIPFCKSICSYCDFCKVLYHREMLQTYLQMLSLEIEKKYKGEVLSTLYIGGGTPSCLSISELSFLFSILKKLNRSDHLEFTIECNIEDITPSKLKLFFENGVNRLSIGVQTFHSRHLKNLHRNHTKEEVFEKIKLAKNMGFQNMNIDLMYGFEGETLEEVVEDINHFLKLDIPHLSIYSLIIEEHTSLFLKNTQQIDPDLDSTMYFTIQKMLTSSGYEHYEVSNFARPSYSSSHNLTYWNNKYYYGFGVGSSGYIGNIRYDHSKSITHYNKGDFSVLEEVLDKKRTIENEWMLGFRKIKGISKKDFYEKYHMSLVKIPVIDKLLKEGKLMENKDFIYIHPKYIYVMNEILIELIDSKESIYG